MKHKGWIEFGPSETIVARLWWLVYKFLAGLLEVLFDFVHASVLIREADAYLMVNFFSTRSEHIG